ncbi:substrate-binding domain-containing protein [Coraliomargarita algicola]|uniref:Substrate-binding domain-containing protein n=1 Tax=Coraliomargarita algicola TaxID=3092156 RepID=A0ABZ0RLN3_9BACT|nr:substrate-binding domain-containing protein [Coraliomargarita sp. J2-16]WPJ95827.1 substrate-binding domain-containing protein [Coraliomargarita sp. J2-16]
MAEGILTADEFKQTENWLKKFAQPTGIFAALDGYALAVQRAARNLDLRVPEDVAILGAGDDDFQVEFEAIPLSSIRLPARKIGYEAGALLDRRLSDPHADLESIQLPVQDIALRRSTDVQYCDDPLVAKAVRLIREHPNIRVTQVVQAVGISRTGLQSRFLKMLGRGILSEIQRVRLQRAQTLLSTTDDKQEVIAELSGFASVQRFSYCFQQAFKMSPGTYRRQSKVR